jgi:hypothetical protein
MTVDCICVEHGASFRKVEPLSWSSPAAII